MGLKDVFNRGMAKINPVPLMREIGEMCKTEIANNRVFFGLKIPSGGLDKRKAKSPERRKQFDKLLQNLKALGFKDIDIADKLSDTDFPADSVFIPIDFMDHPTNRKLLMKMLQYTDYMKHSHNEFPKDWGNTEKPDKTSLMRTVGEMCKTEIVNNRVFFGLKIPSGGLNKREAQSPERRQLFDLLLQNLKSLGFKDIEIDDKLSDTDFPADSVFVPIDFDKHRNNRKMLMKMLQYTDYMKHSHNQFPKDWER